ncbi:MAG: TolC family protein [Candidatus Latescibacterota bacterium]|nr:TolC family protein [Candidatus Latescibacterota bacterium]
MRIVVICSILASLTHAAIADDTPLTLGQCIEIALAQNTDVRLAEEGLTRSHADAKSAYARRLPSISAGLLSYSRSRTGPSVRIQDNPAGIDPVTGERIFVEEETRIPAVDRDNYSLSANLNHTIFDAGEGRHSHNAARASVDGASFDFEARRAQVVFSVKQAYFSLLKASELTQVQQESLELSQRRLEEAKARLEVGAGTRVDMLRLQVAAENTRADLINLQQQERLAIAQLNYLMGLDVLVPLTVVPLSEGELRVASPPALGPLVEQVQARNPDLQRLQASVRAAQSSVKSSQSAYAPRVSGNLSYSRSNEVFDRVYGNLSQEYRLNAGLSLSYNVFDGGIRSAGVRRSKSSLNTARLTLEARERDIALNVETTWLELDRLRRILDLAEGTVELATEDLHLAEERYRVGKGTVLEALDAQVGFTEARSSMVRARYDLAVADADLQRLQGEAGAE